MPRVVKKQQAEVRHDPLYKELAEDDLVQKFGRVSKPGKRVKSSTKKNEEGGKEEGAPDAKMSRKILELAREQQDEMDQLLDEDAAIPAETEEDEGELKFRSRNGEDDDEDEDEDEDYGSGEEEEEYEELEIDPEDHATLAAFMGTSSRPAGQTLADVILAKLEEGADEEADAGGKGVRFESVGDGRDPAAGLPEKVVIAYTKIGELLSRYRSGPLPKPFKLLPSLPQWARLLALTSPADWTPHATFAATKIFVSNLKPKQATVFLRGILLERVRDDMSENGGKLNYQLYEALKKALYKPAAFFKGILFPLCDSACTLKEAAILSSVLSKSSVPMVHSGAAIAHLAQMDYTGPNSLFIRVLLDKKYALPYKVVDALVFHFIRLANDKRGSGIKGEENMLPVLWHQSLLVFVQRYSSDLTPDQKDSLLDVIRVRPHAQISPEIRRELVSSVVRGEPREGEDMEMEE
ncbi:Bystin-domain-containing protein [Mrakia frigida]|uniref:snoRNA-binding rRNA-processing protein ENP1 n=1 Tax=Mrakia frigida TaxID=29902 RepID=UPI003FCC1EB8